MTLAFFYSAENKHTKTEFGVEPGFWSGFSVLSRHGPVWRYSVRILKEVDLQRCQTVFREHTTSYHNTLSRTSSVLTPSPYPHSSLSLALRSFGFLHTSTPPGLVPSFTRAYGCTVSDYIRVSYTPTPFPCPHSSLSCALRSFGFCSVQTPQSSCLILRDHMTIVYPPPPAHTLQFHFHSGSSVSAVLPQRDLRLLRWNRCIEIVV